MEIFRPGGLELTKQAAKATGIQAGQMVLDIGCGTGTTLKYLTDQFGAQAYGVDLSVGAIQQAKNKLPEADFCIADGCSLPYPDSMFDAIFMECTLTLMREPMVALQEATRVLKCGGKIVISGLSAKDSREEDTLCDNGRIVKEKLISTLKECGFRIILNEDQSDVLVQFLADVIFQYGSLRNYVITAQNAIEGCVLDCSVPVKGTGYLLVVALKEKT